MWLEKFLDIISRFLPFDSTSGIEEALARLNPDKFYLENVRSVLGVSDQRALQICESAVRQGFLKRRVEVLCPDGSAAASSDTEAGLPPIVRCWREEDGHYEEVELPTNVLQKISFYQLNESTAHLLF